MLPLPANGAGQTGVQIAEVASKCADYETIGHWVRRQGRKKGSRFVPSLEIVDVLDAGSDMGGTRFDFWMTTTARISRMLVASD